MGRYVDINVTQNVAEKVARPKYTAANLGGTIAQSQAYGTCLRYGGKAWYDGKQCWQYKLVLDRPGAYCWTVPAGVVCARTVIVGGGGKPKCVSTNFDGTTCNSAAGAGGAYSEKCHAVTPGSTYFCIIVGRQEQDSTVSCNGTAVHTAGGASGMIPGAASGGDWNSRGGCAGWTCNYCGGSYSHYCGSCKYLCLTNCCGYCVVYQYDPTAVGGATCCNILLAGGGSAGSPRHTCGGCSSIMCGNCWSGSAGGGAGIGQQCNPVVWQYTCCSCICTACQASFTGDFCMNYPTGAQGGGGSKAIGCQQNRAFQGCCQAGIFKGGDGGWGGPDPTEGCAWTFEWGFAAYCAYPYGAQCNGTRCFSTSCRPICSQEWWDIADICGSGSPGVNFQVMGFKCVTDTMTFGDRPKNAGEGAGTGGILHYCCNPQQLGIGIGATGAAGEPLVNWTRLCQLGLTGWCDQAWLMRDSLFPFFVTCAGTLGGSGGVGWCGYTSKAGYGGGGGQAKCQFLCVCWGGAYDCCNQVAATPLAFPPCLLDQMVSNAGTGMAIIYYREA